MANGSKHFLHKYHKTARHVIRSGSRWATKFGSHLAAGVASKVATHHASRLINHYTGSHTHTHHHKAPENITQQGQHGDQTIQSLHIVVPGAHKKKKNDGYFEIFAAYSAQNLSKFGGILAVSPYVPGELAQATNNAVLIPPMFTLTQIFAFPTYSAVAATFTANTIFQNANASLAAASLFEIDPNTNTTESSAVPFKTGTTEVANQGMQRSLQFNSIEDHVVLTNFSLLTVRIKVVYFLCKRNCSELPGQLMDRSILGRKPAGTTVPTVRPTTAVTMKPGWYTSGSIVDFGVNNMNHHNFPLLNQYWKPIKVHNCILAPGDNHEMHVNVIFEKYYKKEKLAEAWNQGGNSGVQSLYFQGLTVVPTVFIEAGNVVQKVASTLNMSSITKGPWDVASVVQRRYKFGYVDVAAKADMQYIENNLPVNDLMTVPSASLVDDKDTIINDAFA